MTFVVKDNCIKCKYTDCVEVCPVDCFYEGENFLVINPDECIDCGVCEPECPAGAIESDVGLDPNGPDWVEINRKYSLIWPNISKMRPAPYPGYEENDRLLNPDIGDSDNSQGNDNIDRTPMNQIKRQNHKNKGKDI